MTHYEAAAMTQGAVDTVLGIHAGRTRTNLEARLCHLRISSHGPRRSLLQVPSDTHTKIGLYPQLKIRRIRIENFAVPPRGIRPYR